NVRLRESQKPSSVARTSPKGRALMKPENPTQLFVYGTLRRDPAHEMFHLLARTAHFVGEARVAGRLYDLGAYPGMTLSPNGKYVKGEIYEVRPDQWERVI